MKKRKSQKAKEKFNIIGWEIEDGSVVHVEMHRGEADPILGTRRADLETRLHPGRRYLSRSINKFMNLLFFPHCHACYRPRERIPI